MSTPSRRRNRSFASCEPCRRGKIRCDHQQPVCASCRRRGRESHCWYHPAPLTKAQNTGAQTISAPSYSFPSENHFSSKSRSSRGITKPNTSIKAPSFQTWPFMPDPNGFPSRGSASEFHNEKARKYHMASLVDIIDGLRFLPHIEKLLQDYFLFISTALVPKAIVLQLLGKVYEGLTESGYLEQKPESFLCIQNASQLAENILRCSSSEPKISATMDIKEFCAIFCGDHLRVETLGLLYTLAARASLYSSYEDKMRDNEFMREMVWCSNSSLRLARELAPQTTDPIIWLAHENLQLMSLLEGDASLSVWRRLGDFATDLFALGLNREATYSADSTPFFLAETRRKTFARAYYLDKIFATVFSRPPRISSRHVDCNLPLDLSDDVLLTITSENRDEVETDLTPDGWNKNGTLSTATWARIRYILGQFREETAEYQIRSTPSIDAVKLRDLSHRCRQTWSSLPTHLRYDPNCWTSDLPCTVSYMHGKVYLSYLHIHFQIYRMLDECHPAHTLPELLQISADMLETVVLMANSMKRAIGSPRDLPGLILIHGLPSAIILTTALEATNNRKPTQILPNDLKSSTIIRNISVLVSQLESVCSPSESNHIFCLQASKAIAGKLDSLLDSPTVFAPKHVDVDTVTTSPDSGSEITTRSSQALDQSGVTGIDTLDLCELDNLDFSAWVIDFDLVTSDGVWDSSV